MDGEEHCEPYGCQGDEECKVVGGERGCFCREGLKFNGRECSDGEKKFLSCSFSFLGKAFIN